MSSQILTVVRRMFLVVFAIFVYAVIVTMYSKYFHYLPQLSFENIWRSFCSLFEICIIWLVTLFFIVFPGSYLAYLEQEGFKKLSEKFCEKYPGKFSRMFQKLFS